MRSRTNRADWKQLVQGLISNPAYNPVRIAVLAAHPDDESIGASVLLARSAEATVIYLTDGAPRDRKLWSPHFNGSREEYAALRRQEAIGALSYAGVTGAQVRWLEAVDQEAVCEVSNLAKNVADILAEFQPDVLVTHPYEGGHPDHDAAALVARLALDGHHETNTPTLLEMTSYHARANQCVTGEFLESNAADEICFQLTAESGERKRKMFDAYASQRLVLGAFHLIRERWRIAPSYDFSRPPHEGKLWYECMGWAMDSQQWRAIAAKHVASLQETSCR
jgi:LmbE family N-acetylglucosaminyl deacetylase